MRASQGTRVITWQGTTACIWSEVVPHGYIRAEDHRVLGQEHISSTQAGSHFVWVSPPRQRSISRNSLDSQGMAVSPWNTRVVCTRRQCWHQVACASHPEL